MIVSSETVGWLETIDAAFGPHTHLCNQAAVAAECVAALYREHLMAVLVKWFLTELSVWYCTVIPMLHKGRTCSKMAEIFFIRKRLFS